MLIRLAPRAPPTSLIADAHAASLFVHGWTFRAENVFLPDAFKRPGGDTVLGDLAGEITTFLKQDMDGFFTDHVDVGVRSRDAFLTS
jgi:glycerophosphoryl diester phosphodiesterase